MTGDMTKLAERAASGDREAYGLLVAAHRDRLFAAAFARTGNREDALDAVQDAVLAGMSAVAGLRAPAAFGRWMERLVASACRDRRRKAARAGELPGAETRAAEAEPTSRLWLAAILESLPEPHGRLLWSFYFSGMRVTEIARAVGRPEGTVKRWLAEARAAALRRAIEMSGTAFVVGVDVSDEELAGIERAARASGLSCERAADVWSSHRAMGDEIPAVAIIAKRMDGPCDAFLLMAMMRNGREPDLSGVPVIMLGPGDKQHAFAAWCAGAECYLSRPFNPEELKSFMARVLAPP